VPEIVALPIVGAIVATAVVELEVALLDPIELLTEIVTLMYFPTSLEVRT
jgi:hypothetical protein